jgi:hypothetical protein
MDNDVIADEVLPHKNKRRITIHTNIAQPATGNAKAATSSNSDT